MKEVLVYDSEHLNISTLISSIVGSKRQKVLNAIRHKTSIKDIWRTLRRKFGSIDISQASLLKKLRMMNLRPKTDEEELVNLEKILEYIDLARRHNRLEKFITVPLIWEMANYLKYNHKYPLIFSNLRYIEQYTVMNLNVYIKNVLTNFLWF